MRVVETIAALCVTLLGVITIALARQLPYQAEYGPGPGFLPLRKLGATLVVLSVFLLRSALKEGAHAASADARERTRRAFFQFAPVRSRRG